MLRIIALSALFMLSAHAQTFSSPGFLGNDSSFFPLATGNLWEYSYSGEGFITDTIQAFVVSDSITSDGMHYYKQVARSINPIAPPIQFFKDTTEYLVKDNRVYEKNFNFTPLLIYDLAAQKGDQWVVQPEGTGFLLGRVHLVDTLSLFGQLRVRKGISYYSAPDSTDTTGFVLSNSELVEGIGLYYSGGGETFAEIVAKGALIDGVLYGDTTSVLVGLEIIDDFPLVKHFQLFPSYPNPFNGKTTIRFESSIRGLATVSIYNALGAKVATVFNRLITIGNYSTEWNGLNENNIPVASGVYFYRLSIGHRSISRQLLYIK